MRYFLHLSYHGRKFHGWQNQKKHISVQEVLEKHLSSMLKNTPTRVHGCGRTDAGVSANQYFCNIDIPGTIDYDFIFRINKLLPYSIVVHDLIPVEENANAQLDAINRTYDFYCHFQESPFLQGMSNFYDEQKLDFKLMDQSVKLLLGKNDFLSFCKSAKVYNNFTECNITNASLKLNASCTRMRFRITGNRFLRGMVRILLANLIRIGMGKMTIEKFESCLRNQEDTIHKEVAKPQGLYLSKIEYPYLKMEPREHFLSFKEGV